MTTALLAKLGFKPHLRTIVIGAPPDAAQAIGVPPEAAASRLAGGFDYIHFFATRAARLDAEFPRLKRHLRAGGMLWVSWPKAGALETDLGLHKVIAIGYEHGLVESKTIGIDATWSAIKFTHPKPGKPYNNRYGTLKR